VSVGGDDTPLPAELLALIDVVSPNESELARLTGLPTGDDTQVLVAARWLQQRGVGTVLVKLGSRGCLLVPTSGEPIRQPAFKVQVVDTTGAGDCFTGAYTVGLVEGLPEAQRLRLACAAAALCVQSLGAMPSMPSRAATEAFLARQA
jgi:ribokinase